MDLTRIARIVSALSVLSGLLAIALPAQVADFAGFMLEPGSGLGYGEVGALYGGAFIALGALGIWGTRSGATEGRTLLAAVGAVWAGFAGGRLLVILVTSKAPAGATNWVFLVIEAAVAALFFVAGRMAGGKSAA